MKLSGPEMAIVFYWQHQWLKPALWRLPKWPKRIIIIIFSTLGSIDPED